MARGGTVVEEEEGAAVRAGRTEKSLISSRAHFSFLARSQDLAQHDEKKRVKAKAKSFSIEDDSTLVNLVPMHDVGWKYPQLC